MLVQLIKPYRRLKLGAVVEMTDGVANVLIRRKIVEQYVNQINAVAAVDNHSSASDGADHDSRTETAVERSDKQHRSRRGTVRKDSIGS